MSTLKLNKSSPQTDSQELPRRKPVRTQPPALRDRSKAPETRKVATKQTEPAQETKAPTRRPARGNPAEGKRRTDQDKPRGMGRERQAGRYPAERAPMPARMPPTPRINEDDRPRLSKVMADRGLCSRREADDWIINGWVKVNGEIIETLGTRIDADAEIVISSYAKEHQAENVTILLHKPVGYVSGQAEDGYEPAVVLVKAENQWSEDPTQKPFRKGFLHGLAPAGRLDIDSTGLLVLTQDGRVARQLIGDDSTTEKEYLVRVEGQLSANGLAKLNHGLSLDGVQLKPAKVSWQNEDQLRFVLREGRKRQIRRMCELVGLKVVGLKRIRIGRIALGKLPPGQWRYLAAHERF